MRTACRPTGFTLVELLVVITIIVLLLALLAPALDTAIYQAELVVCGAQIKTVCQALTDYAVDQKRRYIHRAGLAGTEGQQGDSWDLELLSPGRGALSFSQVQRTGEVFAPDLRPQLRPYLALNRNLQDPFIEPVDIERARDNEFVYQSYLLFAGWRYTAGQGGSGMHRIGDRIAWEGRQYSVMVADVDKFSLTKPNASSSHPDTAGLMQNIVWQGQDAVAGQLGVGGSSMALGTDVTRSWWLTIGTDDPVRGALDLNFGYSDLSVQRHMNIRMPTNTTPRDRDERMDVVPWQPHGGAGFDGAYPTAGVQVPRQ
jgi:prepilin-type N-terminal cleavage/methylation domain-containing protein